eukprot:TRINITY_DN5582_c0_g3_i1.p1 TRINITY_DN5582_c0_g3~~TRINITY_DN5582_c0_g3_i1.p1  ORF type:complete len:972 (+),score=173.75 TRINITY_DN5582_c0_g3_i1:67-2982(+)
MSKVAPKLDFLNLDPDEVMRTMSVGEVETVANRLQREVDTKREELRVMVGERYRDLIEAADTIQTMKTSSECIIQGVSSILGSSSTISSLSSNIQSPRSIESSIPVENHSYLSVAASIQLLMKAPERIWQAVDKQELTSAAQLYLISQHVYTGLQGDQGGGISPDRIRQWFPVISRYYATINNFYVGIINSANECLMSVELSNEKALQALTALLLLKGLSSEDLLSLFLKLRRQCLEQAIIKGRSESARSSLCAYLRATICTVRVVAALFAEHNDKQNTTSLARFVVGLTDPQASQPVLNLFGKSGSSQLQRYLPAPVRDYTTRLTKPFCNIQHNALVAEMDSWLNASKEAGQSECGSLLQDINTIQGVAAVKQAVWHFLQNFEPYGDWKASSKSVLSEEINLWESFYQRTVRERIESLISQRIQIIVTELNNNLKDESSKDDLDLGAFIWQETNSDLNNLWNQNNTSGGKLEGLSLKCAGWSPAVKSMCSRLEENLAAIWKEICDIGKVEIIANQDGEITQGPFDRQVDHELILAHYRQVLTSSLANLVDSLTAEENPAKDLEEKSAQAAVEKSTKDSPENSARGLFLARSLQSIPGLVSTLHTSLQSKENSYSVLVQKLSDASKTEFWSWASTLLKTFEEVIQRLSLSEDPLSLLPAWDTVNIQESSEAGSISSTIRIPSCPSAQLLAALHNLSVSLHSAHPATIPPDILNRISVAVCEIVFQKFSSLLTSQAKLTQVVALQMEFNVQFLVTMFLSRDFKDKFSSQISDIQSRISSNIDPFDQSVFCEHMTARVKRTCTRELSCLSPLVPKDRVEIIVGFKSTSTTSSSSQDVSNIMNLNPSPPSRFQLLPMATPSSTGGNLSSRKLLDAAITPGGKSGSRSPRTPNYNNNSLHPNNSKTPSTTPYADAKKLAAATTPSGGSSRKRDKSPVAAAAASFFGSMGSSWFGGGSGNGAAGNSNSSNGSANNS